MEKIPEPFSTIQTLEDAGKAIQDAGLNLSTEFTKLPSQFTMTCIQDVLSSSFRDLGKLLSTKDTKAINGFASEVFAKGIRHAAPQQAQIFCMSERFLQKSKSYFDGTSSAAENLSRLYDKYLPDGSECRNHEELALYRRACSEWRSHMGELIPEDLGMQDDRTTTEIRVGNNALSFSTLLMNLEIKKAKLVLPLLDGRLYAEEVKEAIQERRPTFSFLPLQRSRRFMYGAKDLDDEGEVVDAVRGPLLVTVAAFEERSQNIPILIGRGGVICRRLGELHKELSEKKDHLSQYETELFKMCKIALAEIQSIPDTLLSNKDSFFNTHFVVFKILKLSVLEFYDFQRVIYVLGHKMMGQKNTEHFLETNKNMTGISKLIKKLSQSTKPCLPPWVMNWKRLTDMIGIIGPCDSRNFRVTLPNPAVSWNYISNLKVINSDVVRFLTYVHNIEESGAGRNSGRIFHSELALNEILSGKRNNFVNTHNMKMDEVNISIER